MPPPVPPEALAEAAVWVARLHGPSRNRAMELECLAWQARSAAHRLAFERCTDTWEAVAGISVADAFAAAAAASKVAPEPAGWWRRGARRVWVLGLAGLAGVAAVVGIVAGLLVFQQWPGGPGHGVYSTGVGEQQVVVLDDGTRVSLNTGTRLQITLSAARRTARIDSGEAYFEVAKDAGRPFVVQVAGNEVVAVGTAFMVRYGGEGAGGGLAVTLIEGRVVVRPVGGGAAGFAPVTMQPGERVRVGGTEVRGALTPALSQGERELTLDHPRLDQVVAWRRSEAVFDDTTLADAMAEMNRYSRQPIVLAGDAALAGRRISGVFRTGDNAAFAVAVAALHHLSVDEQPGRITLAAQAAGKP